MCPINSRSINTSLDFIVLSDKAFNYKLKSTAFLQKSPLLKIKACSRVGCMLWERFDWGDNYKWGCSPAGQVLPI